MNQRTARRFNCLEDDLRRPSIVSGTGASLTKYEPQGSTATGSKAK